jgi:hypothetical protein
VGLDGTPCRALEVAAVCAPCLRSLAIVCCRRARRSSCSPKGWSSSCCSLAPIGSATNREPVVELIFQVGLNTVRTLAPLADFPDGSRYAPQGHLPNSEDTAAEHTLLPSLVHYVEELSRNCHHAHKHSVADHRWAAVGPARRTERLTRRAAHLPCPRVWAPDCRSSFQT